MEVLISMIRMAVPLSFASMGGLLSERSGVINIALEAFMLMGALTAAVVAHFSGSPWLGFAAALVVGTLFGCLYCLFVIKYHTDQIVTGTAFNILAFGIAPFVTKILFNSTGSTPALALSARFTFEPILVAAALVIAIYFWLFHTHSGLWVRFAGENPQALASYGVSVKLTRWICTSLGAGLAALGGASLSIYLSSSYSTNMTAGRGFIALAALIFGRWSPLSATAACLFFGFTEAIQMRLQGVSFMGATVPVQFIQVLPYLITIVAVGGFFGKSRPPKSLGRAFALVGAIGPAAIAALTGLTLMSSQPAHAWGERGHSVICEAAVQLVQEKDLKVFLQTRSYMMAHLCNIPDTSWRKIAPNLLKHGNASHFLDTDILGLPVKDIPENYEEVIKEFTGKKNQFNGHTLFYIPTDLGSIWWRADQFVRRATQFGVDAAKATPANGKLPKADQQNDEHPFNKNIFEMITNMGVLGHYVGDVSQPFHSAADHDGYKIGHGGIHWYYESDLPGYFDLGIGGRVVTLAQKLKHDSKATPFLAKDLTPVHRMKLMSMIANEEIPSIYKFDKLIEPSTVEEKNGMEITVTAKREHPEVFAKNVEPLITRQFARSALLLALFWDEIYVKAGRPNLKAYGLYKYPMTPEFVLPDYYPIEK